MADEPGLNPEAVAKLLGPERSGPEIGSHPSLFAYVLNHVSEGWALELFGMAMMDSRNLENWHPLLRKLFLDRAIRLESKTAQNPYVARFIRSAKIVVDEDSRSFFPSLLELWGETTDASWRKTAVRWVPTSGYPIVSMSASTMNAFAVALNEPLFRGTALQMIGPSFSWTITEYFLIAKFLRKWLSQTFVVSDPLPTRVEQARAFFENQRLSSFQWQEILKETFDEVVQTSVLVPAFIRITPDASFDTPQRLAIWRALEKDSSRRYMFSLLRNLDWSQTAHRELFQALLGRYWRVLGGADADYLSAFFEFFHGVSSKPGFETTLWRIFDEAWTFGPRILALELLLQKSDLSELVSSDALKEVRLSRLAEVLADTRQQGFHEIAEPLAARIRSLKPKPAEIRPTPRPKLKPARPVKRAA